MTTVSLSIAIAATSFWAIVLLLPWRPWSMREHLEPRPPENGADLSNLTALIPARNEAAFLPRTLDSLVSQGTGLSAIVVDDCSEDGTADAAAQYASAGVRLVKGAPLPDGWAGKLWALDQGLKQVSTSYTLLLDADISLEPGMLAAMLNKMRNEDVSLLSLMAELRKATFWERTLMPPFVFFFKLLYPFRLSNSRLPWVAAAAGGCILVETRVLRETGAFGAWRGAIIDDCTLARRVKAGGFRIWTGVSRGVISRRPYRSLSQIWNVVARSAFTQLRYSPILLGLVTLVMLLAFGAPLAMAVPADTRWIALAGLATMIAVYAPTLRYYRLSPLWAAALPPAGLLYLAMTWTSAIRYWRGVRSEWKNRIYRSTELS